MVNRYHGNQQEMIRKMCVLLASDSESYYKKSKNGNI